MNLDHILCTPVAWTQKVCPDLVQEEYPELCSFFHGRIVEIFCRGGSWGQILTGNGHTWSGMDTDAEALEQAFLRGVFSVSVGLFPSEDSCDMIFSATAPFSMVSHGVLDDFVQGLFKALAEKGTVLLSLWGEPQTKPSKPLMYTHNGKEKLVMACSVDVVENIAKLDMEWMIANEGRDAYFDQYKEERYLHYVDDLCHHCTLYFDHVEVLLLAGRKWLFAKKS